METKEEKKEVSPANHLAGVHTGEVKNEITEKPKDKLKVEQTNANHLSGVHTGEIKVETEMVENRNHYDNGKPAEDDTKLGEVPEVLPTELGGHAVVDEVDETPVAEKVEETPVADSTEEGKKKDDSSDSSEAKS